MSLTPRQKSILDLLLKDKSPREIAGELGIAIPTVNTHIFDLRSRAGVRTTAGLVKWAMKSKEK